MGLIYIGVNDIIDVYAKLRQTFYLLQERAEERELEEAEIFR